MTDATELPINQKEYLKKYLAIGRAPGEKKKKKKKAAKVTRVQIIDDDEMPAPAPTVTGQSDPILIEEDEDAPQIVAIIDERPHFMRTDDKTKNPLWQPVGTVHEKVQIEQKPQMISFKIQSKGGEKLPDRSPTRRRKNKLESTSKREDAVDIVIKEERLTPPRNDVSPQRRREIEMDISPPRKERLHGQGDMSPPRRSRNVDLSPPRKRPAKSDDMSPPRRSRNVEKDSSPPRKRNIEKDRSPPRRKDPKGRERKSRFDPDYGESRKRSHHSKTDDRSEDRSQKKMEKTLEGKKAGLQNASDLMEETRNFKSREDKMFKSLTKDVSGQNAGTVHRDRQTGRIRNLEEEEERQRKKKEEEEKQKEKYDRWGRGLAQIESRDRQVQEELHEMSKPLARYADDEDLERFLKEQEREGDPMLAYIRKKKRKKAADAGEVTKPQFEGDFLPNRYGIRPGHRWDGVDRSNGYEKKWFEVQNQKRAIQEDSYKWSTEDM